MMDNKTPLIIVGNGISGVTVARHTRKRSTRPIVIVSEEHPYFFSRTALMYVYMGHMPFEHTQPYENEFWEKNDLQLLHDRVVDFDPQLQKLYLKSGAQLKYGDLVWALGSIPNSFGWPGEKANRVQGLYHKQDLEQLEAWTPAIDRAVVVGGGLIGIELAEMLQSRGKKVSFLVRESSFWNEVLPPVESKIVNEHIRSHGIDLRLNTELQSIDADAQYNVRSIHTHNDEKIDCQYVGLTVGVRPNIDFLRTSALHCDQGILVNRFMETNLPHVYAIGDCAQQTEPLPGRKAIEAVWYTGRMMGETLAQTLLGHPTAYQPGPWFNSAKFFDIEYQTYGQISAKVEAHKEEQWFWQHPKKPIVVRWAYRPKDRKLLGMQALGLRLRHERINEWLLKGIRLENAVTHFNAVHFDPELTPNYHSAIQQSFQSFTNACPT